MMVYLERIDPAAAMARFYRVAVVPTLFGSWAVVREWGRIGQGGTVREEAFDTEADAVQSVDAHVLRKRRGGYALTDVVDQRSLIHEGRLANVRDAA